MRYRRLALVLLLPLASCAAFGGVLDNLTAPGPEGSVARGAIGESVDAAVEGTPLESVGGIGLGALVTTLLGIGGGLLSQARKNSAKRSEMWKEIGDLKSKVR